jgi:hypothetical protein
MEEVGICILWPFGVFTDIRYNYIMGIWYISWLFGIILPVLVSITEKNLATLDDTHQQEDQNFRPLGNYLLLVVVRK